MGRFIIIRITKETRGNCYISVANHGTIADDLPKKNVEDSKNRNVFFTRT